MNSLTFITGQPCSGKSFYANQLTAQLTARGGHRSAVVINMGSVIRACMGDYPFEEGIFSLGSHSSVTCPAGTIQKGVHLYSLYERQFGTADPFVLGVVGAIMGWFRSELTYPFDLGSDIIVDGFPRSVNQVKFLCAHLDFMCSQTKVGVHWMDPSPDEWASNLKMRITGNFGLPQYMRMSFEQQRFANVENDMNHTLEMTAEKHYRRKKDVYGVGRIVFEYSQ